MFNAIGNMLESFSTIIKEACQDNATGKYSHSRIIAMVVAFGATVFMWKLAIAGLMTIEYFLAYLAYGTGYQTVNKFLDNKDSARNDQARSMLSEPAPSPKTPVVDDLPKPPKN
jgi:hypothetical protein